MKILGIAVALAACAQTPPATSAVTITAATTPRATPATVPDQTALPPPPDLATTVDGRVSNAIYAGMLSDAALAPDAQEVDIATSGGTVTLSGRVHTVAERAEIERKARNTDGVRAVDDRIRVMR